MRFHTVLVNDIEIGMDCTGIRFDFLFVVVGVPKHDYRLNHLSDSEKPFVIGICSKGSAYLASALSTVIHRPFFLVLMHNAIVETDTRMDSQVSTKQRVLICLGNKVA